MATVYLPFGYPAISGESFETMVYQGNVVRKYTLAKDPRTDSQLYERKWLADFRRVQGTAGTWVKRSLAGCLGAHWSSAWYALVKADDGGFLTTARAQWDATSEGTRDQWRVMALVPDTFNDPGLMTWLAIRTALSYLNALGGFYWGGNDWDPDDYLPTNDPMMWFMKSADQAIEKAWVEENDDRIVKAGTWSTSINALDHGGQCIYTDSALPTKVSAFVNGKGFKVCFRKNTNGGELAIFVDGAEYDYISLYAASVLYQQTYSGNFLLPGMHLVELHKNSGTRIWCDAIRAL